MNAARPTPLLRIEGLTKRFGDLVANDGIDLDIAPGEIHAILGENGAGKSTLMKMIYGVLEPDAGAFLWEGEDVVLRNPAHARALGIGMVFQHFTLFESLTVAENIALAIKGSVRSLRPQITEISQRFGLPVDPDALVHSLSMGERQRVEIIRCLLQEPRLVIMDEPTSVLPPSAVPLLFETIRKLAEAGCAILFISHKLAEIKSLCHTATVMRGGKVVATVDPMEKTSEELATLMIGREIPHPTRPLAVPERTDAIAIKNLTVVPSDPFGSVLQDIDLQVRPGEIVGIAGVSGNGQKELAAILSGETVLPAADREAITMFGEPVADANCGQRRALGLAFVPEDRNGRGAVPEMSLTNNAVLTAHRTGIARNGWIDRTAALGFTAKTIETSDVRCRGTQSEARSLSGGNLQKFILGREIGVKPKVLVAAQPTWGVDVGAATAIRQQLVDLRSEGIAILVISDDLEELVDIADRFHVIFRGHLSPSIDRVDATEALIGRYMAGEFLEGRESSLPAAGVA